MSLALQEEHLGIEGVVLKKLVCHADERGFFMEMIRQTDPFFTEGFGQLSHSKMYPGVAKAWHIHPTQVDWWYVPVGRLKVGLSDQRPNSPTFNTTITLFLGEDMEPAVLRIPPGVAHGCKAIGGVSHLFYVTSGVYTPSEEGRIPHNDESIQYDWERGTVIT